MLDNAPIAREASGWRSMIRQHSAFLALAIVCGGALFLSNSARSQLGVAKGYVQIQSSTPGTAQSGHSNISGTARAGQFVGGGAGLSGVNADLIDGLDSSAFLTGIPNPLLLSGNAVNGVVQVVQTGSGHGIVGQSSTGDGVQGVATSSAGTGMYAANLAGGIALRTLGTTQMSGNARVSGNVE